MGIFQAVFQPALLTTQLEIFEQTKMELEADDQKYIT